MSIGEIVLVKSFPNDPVVRRVYQETEDVVLICLEGDFTLWKERGIKPLSVKCPKARVFRYDNDLVAKLKEAAYSLGDDKLLDALWERAQTYYRYDKVSNQVDSNAT